MNQVTSRQVAQRTPLFTKTARENLFAADRALSRAVALGSTAAIEDLYTRHRERIYALCLRLTKNPAEAEDLTHDVFIHLLRKISSFRGESQFTTWLHRLTVNFVLMHFRRKAIQRSQSLGDLEGTLLIGHARKDDAGRRMVDKIALDVALSKLPAGSRSVLEMFDIEGYSHEEIANVLGCSVGTSKSQLHHGRMKLRRALKNCRLQIED